MEKTEEKKEKEKRWKTPWVWEVGEGNPTGQVQRSREDRGPGPVDVAPHPSVVVQDPVGVVKEHDGDDDG